MKSGDFSKKRRYRQDGGGPGAGQGTRKERMGQELGKKRGLEVGKLWLGLWDSPCFIYVMTFSNTRIKRKFQE